MGPYLLSLPERALRVLAALVGGLLYELGELVLPIWLRRTRLYQSVVGRSLRVAIELIGGVGGVLPPENVEAGELALRKTLGGGIEMASILAVGLSPVWVLAATADLTGGTRAYLRALATELRRDGLLPPDTDVTSVNELLDQLEDTSALLADTVDVPPLDLEAMHQTYRSLKANAASLPDARRLDAIYDLMQSVMQQESRSLRSVSWLLARDATRAGVRLGSVHVIDHYEAALRTILAEGLPDYTRRVSRPYRSAAAGHLDPGRISHTERFLAHRAKRGQ